MKKRIFYLFPLFILLLCVVCSCKDGDNEPTLPEPSPEITIPSSENLNPVLLQEGGTVSISFTTTADWTASLINTRAESWITVTPSSGSKGKNEITIATTANETYDERNATVVLKCGSDSKNIVVTQKQKDALTVTSSKYEVDSKGGNISIEVKANINFEAEIKADWIKQQTGKTCALTTSNLNFTIEPNETGEKREGEIIIRSGELSETVTVYQGFDNFITLTKKDFTIPEEGGNVDVEIKSTLDYEVKMLPDVDWITELQSRAVSTHTHHYTVSSNDTYDSREAKIVFYNPEDENVADTVSIYQMYKGAILIARNEYQFDVKGGNLNLTVQTNLDFNVEISDTWIQQVQPTRALTEYNLSFAISENTEQNDREGTITVKDKNSERKQTITVKQSYADLEREALIALYKATTGDNWIDNTNWCSDRPVSEWYGVTINEEGMLLLLSDNNLLGKLPQEIGNLENLVWLCLDHNKLSGSIPESIGNLKKMKWLDLTANSLSGSIPESVGSLENIEKIDLSSNNITDVMLPENLGGLKRLKRLDLSHNKLSSIPKNISKLENLESLSMYSNLLAGNIPTSVCELKNIITLDFGFNQLTGKLPENIGKLKKLSSLGINNNQLTDKLPASLGDLTELKDMHIGNNLFVGNLPENMRNLKKLKTLEASSCNFEGNIPKWLEELPLETLNLQNNRFSGSVSMEMWNRWGVLISVQQFGYIVSPEDYYVSTDFSKDGEITIMQIHSKGSGIKLVLMGDLFVDKDMGEGGKYETLMKLAMENVFSIEPVKSLRDYFDVFAIKAVSENDWASGKTAFETLSKDGMVSYNMNKCKEYALKATGCNSLNNTHIILVNLYAGAQTDTEVGHLFDDSFYQTSLSCCRYNKEDPDGFEDMIHQLVIGYGIGLLHNEFYIPSISSSSPTLSDIEIINSLYVEFGKYANIDFTDDLSRIRWAHLVDDSRYKNEGIGAYEGANWIYGAYRSTKYSIMREGIWEDGKTHYIVNQFNAPSREAIYKNIMKRGNGKSWIYDFEEFVELDTQGREDWIEAINNINERSIQRDSKYIYSKHYNHPIVIK